MNHPLRYKYIYRMFLVFGAEPPYIECFLPSKISRFLFFMFGFIPFLFSVVQSVGNYLYLATQTLPTNLFLMLLRKNIAVSRLMVNVPFYLYNRPRIQAMMDIWEDDTLLQKNKERRQAILDQKIKDMNKKMYLSYFLQGIFPQLYFLLFFLRPYAPETKWLFIPHDINAWYHYPFGIMNNCIYSFGPVTTASYDLMRLHIIFMIESQLDFLSEDLSSILATRNNVEAGSFQRTHSKSDPDNVKIQLQEWVKAHQRTLRWAKDFSKIFSMELVNKYLYLGTYSCLVAFSVPRWLRDGRFADIAVVCTFAFGTFFQHFLITRQLDKLEDKSSRIFESAFHYQWYNHPKPIQTTLQIVGAFGPARPIQFKIFKIFCDNTDNFKSILSMSYQCLTVIMQLPY